MPINYTTIPTSSPLNASVFNTALTELDNAIKKNNYAATTAPTTAADTALGYSVGSRWIDVTNDKAYVCVDATTGAAVWKEISLPASPTFTGDVTITANLIFSGQSRHVFVGDNANAKQTAGITINQVSGDDEIFSLKAAAVSHGMTDLTEDDTYGAFAKVSAATGGLLVSAYTEASVAMAMRPRATTEDTTKSTAGRSYFEISPSIKSGASTTTPGANANLFGVLSNGTTRFIVDQEGDLHFDGTSNASAWDDHDDLALVETYRILTANPDFKRAFAQNIQKHARVLAKTGVIQLNRDGHHFVSVKGWMGLMMDALRQVGMRLERIEHGQTERKNRERKARAICESSKGQRHESRERKSGGSKRADRAESRRTHRGAGSRKSASGRNRKPTCGVV